MGDGFDVIVCLCVVGVDGGVIDLFEIEVV